MEEEAYYGFDEEAPAFEISRDDDATWVLSGDKLEKLFNMTNFDRDEAVMNLPVNFAVWELMKHFVLAELRMVTWSASASLSLNSLTKEACNG